MASDRFESHSILIEFVDDAPVLEPVPLQPNDPAFARITEWQERFLAFGDAEERRTARGGLTTGCARQIRALLLQRRSDATDAATTDAVARLDRLKGRIAEPAELEALVESLAAAVASEPHCNGSCGGSLKERYPQLMASDFGPLIDRIRELAEMPESPQAP